MGEAETGAAGQAQGGGTAPPDVATTPLPAVLAVPDVAVPPLPPLWSDVRTPRPPLPSSADYPQPRPVAPIVLPSGRVDIPPPDEYTPADVALPASAPELPSPPG
ncbi:MAG: hypothetical protein ACRDOE_00260 [Streptosporangiaceae bacterium]